MLKNNIFFILTPIRNTNLNLPTISYARRHWQVGQYFYIIAKIAVKDDFVLLNNSTDSPLY